MEAPLLGKGKLQTGSFSIVCLAAQALITVGFLAFEYDLSGSAGVDGSSLYNFYVGVALMMFVGFGYLMTFLQSYGLGAVGFTMFITCLGVEWAVLVEQIFNKDFTVNLASILNGNFAVAAVLISFGALIGKVSPTQVTLVVLIELVFYCANKVFFLNGMLGIADCGGTIIIHVFGAYFGLACAMALGAAKDETLNKSSYTSDLFSLVGTVFLWLYWPSFVAGAVADPTEQNTALINTVLALLASTVVTFLLTPIFSEGRLTTVPIQNATLAGGVSIGATANLPLGPGGAVLVGMIAGGISTYGFCYPLIESAVDTCGINNLHGMPGIFGGLVSAAVPVLIKGTSVSAPEQLIGLVGTLVVSSASGFATGKVLAAAGTAEEAYNDVTFWDCADDVKQE